jgi:transposase
MDASMIVEGSADGEAFLLYIEHFLCPNLKRGQIMVIDNLSVRKSKRVRELTKGCGCHLVFLPRYSRDFNPIEVAFSKVKTLLREATRRGALRHQWKRVAGRCRR